MTESRNTTWRDWRAKLTALVFYLGEDIGKTPKVHTPEQIHETLQVVYRRNWIPLIVLAVLIIMTVAYMLFGRIPISAKGNAMFLTRGTVVPFQATASGQIAKWNIKVGDYVKKGQILATLDQPLSEKQLTQAGEKLADLDARNKVLVSLEGTYNELELQSIDRERQVLSNQIVSLEGQITRGRELAEANHKEKMGYHDQNEADVKNLYAMNTKRSKELIAKLKRVQLLRKEQLASADEVIRARQALNTQRTRLSELDLQLLQFNLKRIQAMDSYLDAMNRINQKEEALTNLTLKLEELTNREAQIEQQYAESKFRRTLEFSDVNRNIDKLRQQLTDNREVRSEYEGHILELTAGEGKLVTKGTRLGTIDAADDDAELEAVAYFKLADGKKIKPGMKIRLTPATVQRQRFGSLVGEVVEVSSYPVTSDGASTVVGNTSVARSLTKDNHQIEVFARLVRDEDTFSGYQWDISDGPRLQITSGTVASALVNIKERAPLTFVIPILRNWDGF